MKKDRAEQKKAMFSPFWINILSISAIGQYEASCIRKNLQ